MRKKGGLGTHGHPCAVHGFVDGRRGVVAQGEVVEVLRDGGLLVTEASVMVSVRASECVCVDGWMDGR